MDVLVVDPGNYTPYYDYQLCNSLRTAGCRVTLLTSHFAYEDIPFAGDPLIRYAFFRWLERPRLRKMASSSSPLFRRTLKALEYPLDLAAFTAYAARRRPDVVHFQWLIAPRLELPALGLLRRRGCRLVHTIHNVQPHDGRQAAAPVHRRLYRTMDAIIVHYESAKREAAGLIGRGEKLAVVPHGSLFTQSAAIERRQARRVLGLPEDQSLILFFGLIEPYKGLDDLLRCLTRLSPKLPEVKLVVAGKPGSGFAAMRELLGKPEIAAKTILRLGYIPSEQVAAYFSAADVVALPYKQPSQSGVLLTAYTFGRPVVASRVAGLGETVAADGTGYVADPGDITGLAAALSRLLGDPTEAERMGRLARHLALTRYSWQRIAAQTIAVYEDTCRNE